MIHRGHLRSQTIRGEIRERSGRIIGWPGGDCGNRPASAGSRALDASLTALKTYGEGSDRALLGPVDAAVAASAGNPAGRKELEGRLLAVLQSTAPGAAKQYCCRQLSLIGSAASVAPWPTFWAIRNSGTWRFALERIAAAEVGPALRASLGKLAGLPKAGVADSLGLRRDVASTAALVEALGDPDARVAAAAASALGNLGTVEAAEALQQFLPRASEAVRAAVVNGRLACAERLLAEGKKAEALAIYKTLASAEGPKHVRLAATRGLLLAAAAK